MGCDLYVCGRADGTERGLDMRCGELATGALLIGAELIRCEDANDLGVEAYDLGADAKDLELIGALRIEPREGDPRDADMRAPPPPPPPPLR